ncbi:organic cation transporter protein-like isoform X2 [Procambarus clarkii]|uniref:organic cation transporter protein-like isoform X2 n=1 Tax=Procambarus clarkii TaxID=6728 RepID=UPI0037424223
MDDTFDNLLTQLGTGKWNILYILTSSFRFFLSPSQSLSGVYLAPAVAYTCMPSTQHQLVQLAHDSCSYVVNTTSSGTLEKVLCTHWQFHTSVFASSLTSEFQLVCEREYLRATYQSVYMLGTFISPLVSGYLADRFGRKIVLVVSQVVMTSASVMLCAFTTFPALLVCRFIIGCTDLLTHYVLALEVCEPKYRAAVGILTGLPWSLGTMWWGTMAYAIRDWRWLQLTVSLPGLLIFPVLYFLDESPRWLIVRGQRGRARRVLEKAARWNKVTLPPEDHLHHLMTQITGEQKDGTCDGREERVEPVAGRERRGTHRVKTPCGTCLGPKLFSNRGITTITLVMCFVYLATSLVFDGLNLSGELYSDNIFLYLILGGLMEIPGNSLTVPIINRYGRRGPLAACFVLCGVMVLALAFIPTGMWQLVLALAMLGKLFISTAFQIIYVYSNELFPTEVRVQGVETGSAVGQLGAIVVPYISIYMMSKDARGIQGPVIWWLPSAVFGSASVMAAASLLALNETVDQDLPETIAQLVSPARKTTLEEEKCVATSGAACVEGDLR